MEKEEEFESSSPRNLTAGERSNWMIRTLERPNGDTSTGSTENEDSDWRFHLVNSQNDEAGNLTVDVHRSYEEIMKHEDEKNSLKASLEAYIEALTTRKIDGEQMVEFPSDYTRLIDQLFLKNRKDYHCLRDWNGPRNNEDLSVATQDNYNNEYMESESSESEISQGLHSIEELEIKQKDKELEGYLIERETFPGKFHAKEKQRLRKKHLVFQQTMKVQQQRLREIAKLKRALQEDVNDDGMSDVLVRGTNSTTSACTRTLRLRPEEEEQLLHVLTETDEDLLTNPFDCDVFLEEDLNPESYPTPSNKVSSECSSKWSEAEIRRENTEFATSKKSSLYQSLRPDYLHELRLEKERNQRLREIDKQLQNLKTEDLCEIHVSEKDIRALIIATKHELDKQEAMVKSENN